MTYYGARRYLSGIATRDLRAGEIALNEAVCTRQKEPVPMLVTQKDRMGRSGRHTVHRNRPDSAKKAEKVLQESLAENRRIWIICGRFSARS